MALGTGLEHCLILSQPVHNLRLLPPAAIAASPALLGHEQLLLPWGIWGAGGWGRLGGVLRGCRVGTNTVQPFQSRLQGCRNAAMQGCRMQGCSSALRSQPDSAAAAFPHSTPSAAPGGSSSPCSATGSAKYKWSSPRTRHLPALHH